MREAAANYFGSKIMFLTLIRAEKLCVKFEVKMYENFCQTSSNSVLNISASVTPLAEPPAMNPSTINT